MFIKSFSQMSKRRFVGNIPFGDMRRCNNRFIGDETDQGRSGFFPRYEHSVSAKIGVVRTLKDERGLGLLGFLLVLIPLVYLTFSPIYFNSTMDTHDKAKAQFYAFLDRVQVQGYLSEVDEVRLNQEFEKIGCEIIGIDGPRESQGDVRILRSDSMEDSLITMKIRYSFGSEGLNIGKLVGAQTPESFDFNLEGTVISERVDP